MKAAQIPGPLALHVATKYLRQRSEFLLIAECLGLLELTTPIRLFRS